MQIASYWLFTAVLIFCPLAFGTVEPWSITAMEFMVPLALVLYLAATVMKSGRWYEVPGLLPLGLFLAFVCLQLVPLPPALLKIISPAGYDVYKPAIALADGSLWLPISINPQATAEELCRLFTYVCFYILTIQLFASYRLLRRTLLLVLGLAAFIAFLAIIQKFTSPDKIYWFREVPANSTATGPWIYHNHFAGFMEMILPLGLALFLHYRPRFHYAIPWREKIISIFTLPNANLHILLGFTSVLMGIAIMISLSRGGMISASLALFVFVLLLKASGQVRTGGLPLFLCILLVVLAMAWFGWEPVIDRFNRMTNGNNELFDGRFLIWQDTFPIIKDYLLWGAGFGTFIHLFPAYRNYMPGQGVVDHAHNDYLELLTDGGVIGGLLVVCFLITLFWRCSQQMRRRRDDFSKLLFCAAATSILAIMLHSVTDFNMHNGANGLYFFFICGLLVSATYTRRHSTTGQSLLPLKAVPTYALGLPVFIFLIAIFSFNSGQAGSDARLRPLSRLYLNQNIPPEGLQSLAKQAREAKGKACLDGKPAFILANISTFMGEYDQARKNYAHAIKLNPTNSSYLLQAGLYLGQKDEEAGRALLTAAARIDRTNPEISKDFADWLLQKGETDKGLALLREALAMEKNSNNFSEYIALTFIHNLDLKAMEKVLPEETRPHIQFATFLAKQDNMAMAASYYLWAMEFLKKETSQPWFFQSPYWFFMGQKDYDKALMVIRKGLEYHPEDVAMHIMAGDVYLKMGIIYRAEEQYRQALLMSPGDRRALRGLAAAKK